ncbi:MAG: DUF2157 domain-containing protein [Coleofasciculaceae cyanobacterium]
MSSPQDRSIKIEVTSRTSQPAFLEGLEIWQRLGLLSATKIKAELTTKTSHPQFLAGLDAWLSLGLINDAVIKELCRENLVCRVPLATTVSPTPIPEASRDFTTDFALEETEIKAPKRKPPSENWLAKKWQSLQAELSVRWLLFLGVFMVVVSSGVLAASQWANFPAAGQYGVLLSYTLIFWGVGYWAKQQSNLRLTSQTLQTVTLLLVPVNFWAMDGFGLWRNPLNLIVLAFATVILSAITFSLCKQESKPPLLIINYLVLSYLHWFWAVAEFPLIAVYLGVGATIATFYGTYKWGNSLAITNGKVVLYAIGILLFRAIFVTDVAIEQLGLALGAFGWFLLWLSPRTQELGAGRKIQSLCGGSLLFFGWLIALGGELFGQAIAVSGLSLLFLFDRLQRLWQKIDLLAIFAVGLQTIWLAWRLIPADVQIQLVATATELTNSQTTPYALLSLVLFPYLIIWVGLTDWLHRREKTSLAELAEQIALSFGIFLTFASLVNPLLRTLNLLNSTISLGIFSRRRRWLNLATHPRFLVYLTHVTALATVISTIDYILPNLTLGLWAVILLGLMVAEWLFSLRYQDTNNSDILIWRESAWYIGLGLAGLSYALLGLNNSISFDNLELKAWGLVWLTTPLALTFVASRTETSKRQLASGLSITTLIMLQLLTLEIPGIRLIGLGIATSLMLVNTRLLRQLIAAVITVGFGLTFLTTLLWEGTPFFTPLSLSAWLVAGAITLTSLCLARSWLVRRSTQLARLYARATDGWAIALCSLELVLLTLHSFVAYWGFLEPTPMLLTAGIITLGAIIYRSFPQPNNWAIYAAGWNLELLMAEGLGLIDQSVINLAIANFALGLFTQLLGDWWQRRTGERNLTSSWHIIPLLYGILGAVLRWGVFTSWTGFSSLALALIALGVGRRRVEFKPLLYLALFGVTCSAYEILFFQLSQLGGGTTGDGLVAMAALGMGIMYAYRVLSPWIKEYLHLSSEELKVIAHLHWFSSSTLLVTATSYPITSSVMMGVGTGVFLIQYAIWQGRNHPEPRLGEIWVYLGFLEAFGMRLYWLSTPVARMLAGPLVPWSGAIASVIAYFIYILPWQRWGWSKRPWSLAAIILPLIPIWETKYVIHPLSLLIAAGFYVGLAILNRQIRFTYFSVALIDWLLLRWFDSLGLDNLLWYVLPLGLSLLYIAQVDSLLRQPEQKQTRHLLRILASGIICLIAFLTHQDTGLVPGVISIVCIFAGLTLKIRAFLFVGTVTFLVNACYQLGLLIFDYPFSKWVIGLCVGIAFIWIAATFETRREQITALVRNWLGELQTWE